MRTMEALKASITKIFEDTGCNTPATRELLGDLGMSESNVLQYLALVEQRTSEIMALYVQKLARAGVPVMQARLTLRAHADAWLQHSQHTPDRPSHRRSPQRRAPSSHNRRVAPSSPFTACAALRLAPRSPSQGILGMSSTSCINIEPPSAAEDFDLSDDSSESEDDDRPLTREELAARTQRKLAAAAAKASGRSRRRK